LFAQISVLDLIILIINRGVLCWLLNLLREQGHSGLAHIVQGLADFFDGRFDWLSELRMMRDLQCRLQILIEVPMIRGVSMTVLYEVLESRTLHRLSWRWLEMLLHRTSKTIPHGLEFFYLYNLRFLLFLFLFSLLDQSSFLLLFSD